MPFANIAYNPTGGLYEAIYKKAAILFDGSHCHSSGGAVDLPQQIYFRNPEVSRNTNNELYFRPDQ